MKNFNEMSQAELTTVLSFTKALAERASFANADAEGDLYEPDAANIEEARKQASEYARAVNSGARARQYERTDENARDGVRSALDWLSRKKKSAIR